MTMPIHIFNFFVCFLNQCQLINIALYFIDGFHNAFIKVLQRYIYFKFFFFLNKFLLFNIFVDFLQMFIALIYFFTILFKYLLVQFFHLSFFLVSPALFVILAFSCGFVQTKKYK